MSDASLRDKDYPCRGGGVELGIGDGIDECLSPELWKSAGDFVFCG